MKLTAFFAGAALSAAAVLAPAHVDAKELKYASVAPAGSPWAKLIDAFVMTAEAKSGGSVKITPYLGGQLGTEPVVIQQVARGRVDFGGFSLTASALVVPELGLLNAPYLWDTMEQAECALDNHLIDAFQPYFSERGLVNLGWGETGHQLVFAQKPMTKAADYDGAKLRVSPSKGSVIGLKALGVNGVVVPVSDTNSSIQTGLVDGAEMNLVFGVLSGAGQLAPHVNMTRHVYLPSLSLMSKRSFDKLSEADQKAVLSSPVPAPKQRATVRAVTKAMTQKLLAAGGQMHELDDAELAQLRAKMTATHAALVEAIGGDAPEAWKAIQAAKAACSQ